MEVFYNSREDVLPNSQVDKVTQELKGETLDNDQVYQTTCYDTARQKHISYVSVVVNGRHRYVLGSGHEIDHGSGRSEAWDGGSPVTWQDALSKRTQSLIR